MLKLRTKHIIYFVLGIIVLVILYSLKNTSYFVRASGFVFSVVLFHLFDSFFSMKLKKHHYLIFVFISATGILLSPLYFVSANYDKILHLLAPILFCILIFFLVNKSELKFRYKLLITFMFMISFLALFEVGEYLLDIFFDLKLQGTYIRDISGVAKLNIIIDKNDDTMIDLILGFIGALIFVGAKTLGFYYKKWKRKSKKED